MTRSAEGVIDFVRVAKCEIDLLKLYEFNKLLNLRNLGKGLHRQKIVHAVCERAPKERPYITKRKNGILVPWSKALNTDSLLPSLPTALTFFPRVSEFQENIFPGKCFWRFWIEMLFWKCFWMRCVLRSASNQLQTPFQTFRHRNKAQQNPLKSMTVFLRFKRPVCDYFSKPLISESFKINLSLLSSCS